MKKGQNSYSIKSEDGATSVFIASKKKLTLRQRWKQIQYNRKKKAIEKTISGENYHSMEEVIEYGIHEFGLIHVDKEDEDYLEEYRQLRASFMLRHQPELLGEYANIPKPNRDNPDEVMLFIEKCKEQVKRAMDIPKEQFDIDMHKLEKQYPDTNNSLYVIIEAKYGYIGGSAVGDETVKELDKIMVSLYRYYGVTQEDIDNKTQRYKDLVSELCRAKG